MAIVFPVESRRAILFGLLLACAGVLPYSAVTAAEEAPLTIDALYGEWIGESYEHDGMQPRRFGRGQKSTLKLNASVEAFELVFSKMQQEKMSGSSSHAVDMTSKPMKFYRAFGGLEPERHLIAIFQLEGDKLTWCWVTEKEAKGETPLELTTRPNDFRTVIHYKRKKP